MGERLMLIFYSAAEYPGFFIHNNNTGKSALYPKNINLFYLCDNSVYLEYLFPGVIQLTMV